MIEDTTRYIRGGSWFNSVTSHLRTYYCPWDYPDSRYFNQGFRCVYPVNNTPTLNSCVEQGGAWSNSDADYFRAHYRYWNCPGDRYFDLGFRCVYSIEKET